MQEWILEETAGADLGDERLDRRFQTVLDTMSQKPSLKFPAGCNGRAEVAGAYRFLDNDKVEKDQIFAPHFSATLERIRAQKVVLIPQDTTELDLTRPHEIMVGAGPLSDESRVGFFDHALLAFTPEGVPLGLVAAEFWARTSTPPTRAPTKSGPSAAPSRSKRRRAIAGWKDIARPAASRRGARHARRLSFRQRGGHL